MDAAIFGGASAGNPFDTLGDAMDSLESQFPILAHESTGADCCSCIVAVIRGNDVELRCNECGALVGVSNTEILRDLYESDPLRITVEL